jgi:hypothetical protein
MVRQLLPTVLLKDSDPEDLLAAIHTVARGVLVLGRGASGAVVAAAASAPRTMIQRHLGLTCIARTPPLGAG